MTHKDKLLKGIFIVSTLAAASSQPYVWAATSSTELTNTSFTQAAQTGFVFALHGQDMPNSQCCTDAVYNARRYRLELINPAGAVVAVRHISGGMVYGVFGASELSPSEVPPGTYRWTVRAAPAADTNIGFGKPREYRTVVLP